MSSIKVTNLQAPSAASPAIVLASDGTATAQLSSLNGGALSGARNRIINGSLDFWQRGTSTTATGNTYLADRWISAFSTGGTVSQETSSLPTGSRYAWKFVASASNAFMQMGQQIEYMNCLDLQNTTVAISFMARAVTSNAGSTALTVRTRTIAGVDGACAFTGANVDTSVTLTTTWTRYTVTRTLPATFGSLSLEFILGSHISGDGIMLSQIQLEPGTVATPFERRSFGHEFQLCERYYEKSYNLNVVPGANVGPGTGEWVSVTINSADYNDFGRCTFRTRKRASPTMSIWSTDGTPNAARQQDAGNVTAIIRTLFNETSGSFGCGGANGSQYHRIHFAASAEL